MACRPLVRRVWALTMKDHPCLPSSTTSICSSLGHPRTARPARFLSRSLCLTPARGVSFNVQDNDDFTERVINSQVPVLIDFHAQWCGPCKILGPRMEKAVAKHQGKVTMAKVDIDEHTDLAIEYGVSAVPTVIAMRGGSVVDQFVGIKDEDQLESFISGLIGH